MARQTLDKTDELFKDSNTIASLKPANGLMIAAGQYSDKGIKATNEDAIGIRIPSGLMLTTKGAVAAISDGVSTAESGAAASAISVSNFLADYYSTPDLWSVEKSSTQVLTALNRWLYGLGQDYRDARRGYVCTFSALVFKSCHLHMFHVGDSRVYRYRDGTLDKLSHDHTSLVGKNQQYLARAMGLDVNVDVDYRMLAIAKDDLYLLTTDGVHDVITDVEIEARLQQFSQSRYDAGKSAGFTDEDCDQFCMAMVDNAFNYRSQDNASCQLLHIEALPDKNIDEVYQSLSKLPFPPPLSIGMTLDGYKVVDVLHESQRSQVYLVKNELGSLMCMKTPSINYLDDAAYIERFLLESWIGKRINSPYVVSIIDRDREKSALYYLTEYLAGHSLSQWIKHNPAPEVQEVLELLKQLEAGVRAFHRKETLHQDLKPDNLMLTNERRLKIIDFGACFIKGIAEITSPLPRDLILGTADYSAPESILGYQVNQKADLYSIAVIAFEMLTGRLPFDGKQSHCKTKQDFLRLKYTPSYDINPLVPIWMDKALKKGLSVAPEQRQADSREWLFEMTQPVTHWQQSAVKSPLIDRQPLLFWQCLTVFFGLLAVLLALF
ncbi:MULTISPECIES: bifunctional protein-serine/threonine kinase/phosphatase [unclassified Shewanella]|uniref:bifunctional protein-serine/threonine kinase/phosphatase n=1 Tax=unclassified Shewanella TaxID=196818 RepID=UPI0015E1004F|nr:MULTISPECIES: bifunctional protein-serine/threonine kinase/phosphatase [unclassified Shewanella]